MAFLGNIKFPHIVEPTARIRTMRYFMNIFSFLFFIFGFGVALGCITVLAGRVEECGFISRIFTGVYLLLGAGCATVFFSLIACLTIRRSSSAANFLPLGIVAIIVLITQVMSAIAGHILYSAAADGGLQSSMNQTFYSMGKSDENDCMHSLHSRFQCCGVQSPSEWLLTPGRGSFNGSLSSPYPRSCQCASYSASCVIYNDSLANGTLVSSSIYGRGCHDVVLKDLQEKSLIPRIVGPVVSLVEFAVVLIVIYFLHHIGNYSLVGVYVVQPSGMENIQGAAGRKTDTAAWIELEERPSTQHVAHGDNLAPANWNGTDSIHV